MPGAVTISDGVFFRHGLTGRPHCLLGVGCRRCRFSRPAAVPGMGLATGQQTGLMALRQFYRLQVGIGRYLARWGLSEAAAAVAERVRQIRTCGGVWRINCGRPMQWRPQRVDW